MCVSDNPRIEQLDDEMELDAEEQAALREEAYEERALEPKTEPDGEQAKPANA